MGSVKNISGEARFVPAIDRQIDAGETVDVADELLDPAHRSWDPDVWQISGGDPRTLGELKAEAEKRGLPVSGTKRDLVERLAAAETTEPPADPTVVPADDENGE